MDGYKISEAARATGFTESALRFYEKEGVVIPDRTAAGYRWYNDADIAALQFVGRAKALGLRLDEITDLLSVLETEDCRPVQLRLRQLLAESMGRARSGIAEATKTLTDLQEAATRLGMRAADGACDEACGCREFSAPSDPAITLECTLSPEGFGLRAMEWRQVAAAAGQRAVLSDGIRLVFSPDHDVATLARLIAEERACCGFLRFTLEADFNGVALEIHDPSGELAPGLFDARREGA